MACCKQDVSFYQTLKNETTKAAVPNYEINEQTNEYQAYTGTLYNNSRKLNGNETKIEQFLHHSYHRHFIV